MNIRLYFAETPKDWLTTDAVTLVFNQLFTKLQQTYKDYNITKKCSNIHSYENGITHNHFPNRKFGFYQCIVENIDNGKYTLINYEDSYIKYKPASYIYHSTGQTDRLVNAESKPKTIQHLQFRGKTYLFRQYLENDSRFDIITTNDGVSGIGNEEFLDEVASQRISLCLNGTAEITYRDIESFASYPST